MISVFPDGGSPLAVYFPHLLLGVKKKIAQGIMSAEVLVILALNGDIRTSGINQPDNKFATREKTDIG